MEPEHDIVLWHTSWLAIISATFAALLGKYDFVVVIICVFLTSINFWRDSRVMWTRILDMTMVGISLAHHLVHAYWSPIGNYYFMIVAAGMICFPISVWFYNQNMPWASTVAHIGVHTLANIACIILLTGV